MIWSTISLKFGLAKHSTGNRLTVSNRPYLIKYYSKINFLISVILKVFGGILDASSYEHRKLISFELVF